VINLLYKRKEGEFEDTKGVIRIRKSKKKRQHNGQKKKDKRKNNNLQIMIIPRSRKVGYQALTDSMTISTYPRAPGVK
jgi:hypothetical protein